jgi:hypothetical protein
MRISEYYCVVIRVIFIQLLPKVKPLAAGIQVRGRLGLYATK